jgi:pimeloyl-ACP methyl ester carboxylesterase
MTRLGLILIAGLAAALPAQQKPGRDDGPHKDGMGRDYWVYAPKRASAQPLWLVVGVHGMGGTGRGAGGLSGWAAQRSDCLVLGPTFPSQGYQFLAQASDTQLLRLVEDLGKRHRLHPKVFLAGFSGGAQFAHRFAHAHPDKVLAVAANSAGSWSTGGPWGEINPAARLLPMLVTCGEADTGKMAAQAPLGRLEWARDYVRRLRAEGFVVADAYPRDVGHRFSPEASRLTLDLFEFASTRAVELERQRSALAALVAKGDLAQAKRQADRVRLMTATVVPTTPRAHWEQSLARAHNAAVDRLLGDGR